ncbi:MAG: hypothetical protein GX410_01500 [Elusimicrobia bacterium]|nr:hypothetical protein [Elusimicrobiota bacterium]
MTPPPLYVTVPLAGMLVSLALPAAKPGLARRAASFFSAAALLLSALALIPESGDAAPSGVLDAFFTSGGIPAAGPAAAAIQLAFLACMLAPFPKQTALTPGRYYAIMLAAQAATGGATETHGWTAFFFWTASAAAPYLALRACGLKARAFAAFNGISCLLLAAATLGLDGGQPWPYILLIIAALIRTASFPMHWWLRSSAQDAPAPLSALLCGPFAASGLYLLACTASHPALQPLPQWLAWAMLAPVCFGAFAALAKRGMSAGLAFASSAHCAAFSFAAALGTPAALQAALLGCTAQALAPAMALLSSSRPEEERPFFSALALAGAPFTATFAGLFLCAALAFRAGPWLALVLITALVMNAAACCAAASKPAGAAQNAQPSSKLVLALLAAAILLGGLFPPLPPGAELPF